jgi:predicted ArsR family transcriptional regulator
MSTLTPPPPLATDTPRHRALSSVSRAGILGLLRGAPGGLTAAEAARASGLHPSTVRAHLDQLGEAALVVREAERHGAPGRPAWRYRAVEAPAPVDSLYHDLAAALVSHLARAEENPAAAGEQAGRDWGRRLARGDAGGVSAGPSGTARSARSGTARSARSGTARSARSGTARSGPARTRAVGPIDGLVGVLDQLGFTPQVVSRDGPDAGVVHLRTCPFMDLVANNPDVVCGLHLGVIRGALGGLGASTAGTELEPFGVEGACVVRVAAARRSSRG